MNPFALTAEERAGAMMAPARAPDVGAFMDNLGALRAMLGPSVASRMQAHGEDQEARWDAGERGPTPLTEDRVWLADDVAGALLGPMGMAGVIKAYHGSPHRFDRFDMSKIGTGEGAQAYGHGLYFAESPGVAKSYRDSVSQSKTPTTQDFGMVFSAPDGRILGERELDAALSAVSRLDYRRDLRRAILDEATDWDALRAQQKSPYAGQQKIWEDGVDVARDFKRAGALYTTRLDVEPEDLLDWDAPLSQQSGLVEMLKKSRSKTVREIMADPDLMSESRSLYGTELGPMTGQDLYKRIAIALTGKVTGDKKVAEALKKAGIPGIRYLDQGSRASGDGTRNFVIFDDSLISIESIE